MSSRVWRVRPFRAENEKDYRQGGLHPVRLGDDLKEGQYKILRKLGYGASATVWLARDFVDKTYVAIKILAAKHTEPIHELQMLQYVRETAPEQAPKFITQLLDTFEHTGPNGVHKCLVFEPMGATVNTMVKEVPESQFIHRHLRYSARMAKSILKQSLQALAFLHSIGLSHGDLHQGNMLFALRSKASFDAIPEDELLQPEDVKGKFITEPLRKEGDDADPSLPLYLCASKPLAAFADIGPGFQIKLSDVGGSYYTQKPPAALETPDALRAPEYVLRGEIDKTQDIWSFGCLVFEIITGMRLFHIDYYGIDSYEDDQLLIGMSRLLGDLPEDLYRHWKTSSLYYTPTRELYTARPGGDNGEEPYLPEKQTMEEFFDQEEPVLDEAESSQVKKLIRRILQYDPAKRPSAAELLNDPWFQQIDVEAKEGEKKESDTTVREEMVDVEPKEGEKKESDTTVREEIMDVEPEKGEKKESDTTVREEMMDVEPKVGKKKERDNTVREEMMDVEPKKGEKKESDTTVREEMMDVEPKKGEKKESDTTVREEMMDVEPKVGKKKERDNTVREEMMDVEPKVGKKKERDNTVREEMMDVEPKKGEKKESDTTVREEMMDVEPKKGEKKESDTTVREEMMDVNPEEGDKED